MKPRTILAQSQLANGEMLELHEHDGRHYLHLHGQQLGGDASRSLEAELAHLGTHPFRPARQPKILVLGLGLGGLLNSLCSTMVQKRARFTVYEPMVDLVAWQKQFFPEASLHRDSRADCTFQLTPSSLARENGTLHAILTHADTCPMEKGRLIIEDSRWLGAARDALQPGGLIGIVSLRPVPGLFGRWKRAGFEVTEHFIDGNPNARKPRRHPLLLARKVAPSTE